jgi:hypothetical protein
VNLGELIDTHRAGRSYNELARDAGEGAPSGKRLQQLATGAIRNFPDPPTIRALARGLRVSHQVVVLAAAESLDLDVRQGLPRVVDLLPVGAARLSEEQASAVAHLIRVFVEPTETQDDLRGIDDEVDGPAPKVADINRRRPAADPAYSEAARDTGKRSKGQQRADLEAAREAASVAPAPDDPDDMEPR